MKRFLLILFCLPLIGFGQNVPQGINCQAVERDATSAVTGDGFVFTQGFQQSFSIGGCTDLTALNYDPAATMDDGSCSFCIQYTIDTLY
jgi:hypothetical protein